MSTINNQSIEKRIFLNEIKSEADNISTNPKRADYLKSIIKTGASITARVGMPLEDVEFYIQDNGVILPFGEVATQVLN